MEEGGPQLGGQLAICYCFKAHLRPGPASSEKDCPPTNPAIRVQFSTEADEYFFGNGK